MTVAINIGLKAAAGALLLFAGGFRAAAQPSFDCSKAQSSAETLVCSDEQLAALDRETARLFALARKGAHMTPDRRNELLAYQRGWIKGRDECWKADDKRACVQDNYVSRIHELRQGYADARKDSDKGISAGPLELACDGFDAGISLTYVQVDPSLASLSWKDSRIVLTSVPSGSGARYAGRSFEGDFALWSKGNNAKFATPDEEYDCTIGNGG